MVKLIYINISQLLSLVVSVAQNVKFEPFGGFCSVCSILIGLC